MKKRTFKWAAVGVFLLSFGMLLFNAKPEDGFRSEGASAPVAVFETMVQHSAPAVEVESTVVREADDKTVLVPSELERETMLSTGDVERRRLVTRSGKYPNRLVIETYVRNTGSQQYEPVSCVEMVADQVLVSLRNNSSVDELAALASQYDAEVVCGLSDEKIFVVRLAAPGLDAVEEAIRYFSDAAASIAYAEPDYVRRASVVPNDTNYGDLWGMKAIDMPKVWDIETGSADVVVAVIDSGMDMDHPDLLPNLWVNADEIAGDNIDNDGNGYIDDVHGWNYVSKDNDPEDGNGHGTHCTGIIGAAGNNASQVVGVCWNISIMPLRAMDNEGYLLVSEVADAIRYAARNGAKVLSNSYGGAGYSQTEYDAINYANAQGCIFVAAAGNGGLDKIGDDNDAIPEYPASYDLPNVISVAATDQDDQLATFSNYGATSVDLAAPGVGILSTKLNGPPIT